MLIKKISKFNSIFSHSAVETNILQELDNIKNGYYKADVELCRTCIDKADITGYNILKSKLPAITFAGTFNKQRRADLLEEYTNIVILDIDKLSKEEISTLKSIFFKDRFVYACWISPSGNGLKVLVKVDSNSEVHKHAFAQISEYFNECYKIEVDKSGSDLSRLCFVSFDSLLYLNIDSEIFEVASKELAIFPIIKETKKDIRNSEPNSEEEKKKLFNSVNKNSARDRNTVQKIIKFLRKRQVSITNTYDNWYRVALAIANTFSYNVAEKYFLELCRLDNEMHDEEKSKNLLKYSFLNKIDDKITLGTVVYLASKHGFTIKK